MVINSQDNMPYPEDDGILSKAGMLTSIHVSEVEYINELNFIAMKRT